MKLSDYKKLVHYTENVAYPTSIHSLNNGWIHVWHKPKEMLFIVEVKDYKKHITARSYVIDSFDDLGAKLLKHNPYWYVSRIMYSRLHKSLIEEIVKEGKIMEKERYKE